MQDRSFNTSSLSRLVPVSIIALMLIVQGCIINVDNDRIEGRGAVRSQDITVSGFSKLSVALPADVIIVQGESETLRITAQSNMLEQIDAFVRGERLVIETDDDVSLRPTLPIIVEVGLISLDALSFAGSGSVVMDTLNTSRFSLNMAGQGDIDFKNLTADELEIEFAGSGDIFFAGTVERQDIELAGSGDIEARDLFSSIVDIEIAGSGSAVVNVADELRATILGSGSVLYLGNPRVDSEILGSGSVSALGR